MSFATRRASLFGAKLLEAPGNSSMFAAHLGRHGVKLLACLCFAASAQEAAPLQLQASQVVAPPWGMPRSVQIHDSWMFVTTAWSTFPTQHDVHVFRKTADSCDAGRCWEWHSLLHTSYSTGGLRVESDGRTLMVGDRGDRNGNNGRVLVYELEANQFTLKQELTLSEAEPGFGTTIALDGSRAAIATVNWESTGAVYLFERQGAQWVHTERVATTDGPTEQFGVAIDLRGTNMIVGANEGNYAVIFHRRNGVWREQRLSSPGPFNFGAGVEIIGDEAFVSGTGDQTVSYYVRDQGVWFLANAFTLPPNPDSLPTVSPGGPLQMIGRNSLLAGGFGGVYLFERQAGEWTITTQFVTETGVIYAQEHIMDAQRRWLAAIDGNSIYVFDLKSLH